MEDEKDTKNETDMEVEKKREAFGNRHLTSDLKGIMSNGIKN